MAIFNSYVKLPKGIHMDWTDLIAIRQRWAGAWLVKRKMLSQMNKSGHFCSFFSQGTNGFATNIPIFTPLLLIHFCERSPSSGRSLSLIVHLCRFHSRFLHCFHTSLCFFRPPSWDLRLLHFRASLRNTCESLATGELTGMTVPSFGSLKRPEPHLMVQSHLPSGELT